MGTSYKSMGDTQEMVKDRARDLEAKRQPRRETASERSHIAQETDSGETRSDRGLLFIWQIRA